ncbi:MAG: nitroreductase family protein [Gracilimonas sp.]|uniref:nitroreductase family protein n=1 Tax=Gracilimonas sp. TaxID=1974203 RepID=UPI0019BB24A9|nr:nitroreductase family protein [Gracilimonas sp.]MBD3617150.1 nitroreductase family protein [Gracilimonas sp.]
MREAIFVPLTSYKEMPVKEMKRQAAEFYNKMKNRRTVRDFSGRPVPREIIEHCLLAAGTAPNGANKQPWHFVAVSDPEVKKKIRQEAEKEEREFYNRRAPEDWLEDLQPFGTDENKPFLEKAPYLIGIFAQSYKIDEYGEKEKHYYVKESVGIATGILITALHNAGLATLTHTPSPMGFLNEILGRPSYEKPFLLLVVGYPEEGVKVPDITKKSLEEISTFI